MSKNFHALGMFKPILLPTPTNYPPESLIHHTIIRKSWRHTLPHPISHTKGEKTPPKLLVLCSHSGWLPRILGRLLCWLHSSPRTNCLAPLASVQTLGLSSGLSIHHMNQQIWLRRQAPGCLIHPLKLDMYILHCSLHHNDLSNAPHQIFR